MKCAVCSSVAQDAAISDLGVGVKRAHKKLPRCHVLFLGAKHCQKLGWQRISPGAIPPGPARKVTAAWNFNVKLCLSSRNHLPPETFQNSPCLTLICSEPCEAFHLVVSVVWLPFFNPSQHKVYMKKIRKEEKKLAVRLQPPSAPPHRRSPPSAPQAAAPAAPIRRRRLAAQWAQWAQWA